MSDDPETENKPNEEKKSPVTKLIVYVLVGLLAYGLLYFLAFNKKPAKTENAMNKVASESPTPEEEENPEEETVITITDKGFEPKSLTVKLGVKVTWINNSAGEVTVNSSPHPAHTDNPVMNIGEFAPGDSKSLVFDKPGTYKYHNHLNPSQTGTVIVE